MKNKKKSTKFIFGAIIIYLGYTFINQQIAINNKKAILSQCENQLKEVSEENKDLLDEVKMSNTYKYVEKLARERLGFIKQGETVVISEEK
ncbi:FtsB family cell division protein [Clostridium grantii]|uniref:Septum formation initiator n=1 Tax=Clostridium grantii DSM 8605 TaxID=1121316 RepID=A0A1M5X976_9CLOT|nr:septum formation initiator family protein [Clostridium grantii]SHH96380.1 Septum formation initiator [Clostridium grantii DSM 8605]